jgi:type II secretory pathway component HofQ
MKAYALIGLCACLMAEDLGPFSWQVMDVHDDHIAIVGKEVPILPIIEELYQSQHKNVVFVSKIKGTLSLDLHGLSPAEALHTVLTSSGYCAVTMGRVDWIGDCKQVAHLQQQKPPELRQAYTVILHHTTLQRFLSQFTRAHPVLAKQIVVRDPAHNRFTISVTPADYRTVEAELSVVDRAKASIRIRAYIMSIDEDYLRDIGIDVSPRAAGVQEWLRHFPHGIADIGVALHAAEKAGKGTIYSSPELVTIDGHKATIEAGHEIPYQERTEDGRGALVFKKAVLSLQVLPTVQSPGRVHLHVLIQQDQPGKMFTDHIAIQTRKMVTDADIASKSTLALGGIVEENQQDVDSGIPVVGDIPLLGTILHAQEKRTHKRQLYIFISPQIIE